MGLKLFHVQKS